MAILHINEILKKLDLIMILGIIIQQNNFNLQHGKKVLLAEIKNGLRIFH
jgi:hypothetical protein